MNGQVAQKEPAKGAENSEGDSPPQIVSPCRRQICCSTDHQYAERYYESTPRMEHYQEPLAHARCQLTLVNPRKADVLRQHRGAEKREIQPNCQGEKAENCKNRSGESFLSRRRRIGQDLHVHDPILSSPSVISE